MVPSFDGTNGTADSTESGTREMQFNGSQAKDRSRSFVWLSVDRMIRR